MATAAACLFVCLAFGIHLVLHETHGDRHSGAQSAPADTPAHEHHAVPSISAGISPSLTIAAANPFGAGCTTAFASTDASLDVQPSAMDRCRSGAIRSGPGSALQPLLSTFRI
ncbi:MAG: hypothetical protein NDJ92_13970 [Thermoanaerobaculia bacterium]|nr:hypothetical protein [Thermoanaerobaculia bacterium]